MYTLPPERAARYRSETTKTLEPPHPTQKLLGKPQSNAPKSRDPNCMVISVQKALPIASLSQLSTVFAITAVALLEIRRYQRHWDDECWFKYTHREDCKATMPGINQVYRVPFGPAPKSKSLT